MATEPRAALPDSYPEYNPPEPGWGEWEMGPIPEYDDEGELADYRIGDSRRTRHGAINRDAGEVVGLRWMRDTSGVRHREITGACANNGCTVDPDQSEPPDRY